jgi:hypothetical protein
MTVSLPSLLRDKRNIFIIIGAVWMALWVVFIVKEDKDGEYSGIVRLYGLKGDEKTRFVYGDEFYDFLVLCRENIPAGSTFCVTGPETLSVKEVQARYFLWPLLSSGRDPDFKIFYGGISRDPRDTEGYVMYREFKGKGFILKKEE